MNGKNLAFVRGCDQAFIFGGGVGEGWNLAIDIDDHATFGVFHLFV